MPRESPDAGRKSWNDVRRNNGRVLLLTKWEGSLILWDNLIVVVSTIRPCHSLPFRWAGPAHCVSFFQEASVARGKTTDDDDDDDDDAAVPVRPFAPREQTCRSVSGDNDRRRKSAALTGDLDGGGR
jgi:hypothetical protein